MTDDSFRNSVTALFRALQETICSSLEKLDGQASFVSDAWERHDVAAAHGGGGVSRVLKHGGIFEQAGVNFSAVQGQLPAELCGQMIGRAESSPFYATGVSLVLHPLSPLIPTTHANFRFLEVAEKSWFGGGMDLTPYYLFPEDATHFHRVIKTTCDQYSTDYYPRFKKWCDEYFFLPHRGETRGVGGIFFDYLGRDVGEMSQNYLPFVRGVASAFLQAYEPIVNRRRNEAWSAAQREFQLLRRGRYVEFNLIYDRGTLFGLKTGGRTESILMSLPPQVRWEYNYQVQPGTPEAELLAVVKQPREWV